MSSWLIFLDGVLRHVEMIECRFCQMAAFASDYKEAMNEEGQYRCTACDLTRRIQDKLAKAKKRVAARNVIEIKKKDTAA